MPAAPPGNGAVYCRSCTARRPQALRQCSAGVALRTGFSPSRVIRELKDTNSIWKQRWLRRWQGCNHICLESGLFFTQMGPLCVWIWWDGWEASVSTARSLG